MYAADSETFSLVGIYGGTFDPIHYGHLRVAEELIEAVDLQSLRFIPAGLPRLRGKPNTSSFHRTAMLRAAIQNNPKFILDTRETIRPGESHSVVSLRELRDETERNLALCFIMGADAFIRFSEWYAWQEIFKLCHLIVVDRPGYLSTINNNTLPKALNKEFKQRQEFCIKSLKESSHGRIFIAPTTLLDISATTIRQNLLTGKSTRYLLPDTVLEYIRTNQLYSPGAE